MAALPRLLEFALEETEERDAAEPVSACMSLRRMTSTRSPEWRRKSAPTKGHDTFATMNVHVQHVPATTKGMALRPKVRIGGPFAAWRTPLFGVSDFQGAHRELIFEARDPEGRFFARKLGDLGGHMIDR